jgi:hypothetical protein
LSIRSLAVFILAIMGFIGIYAYFLLYAIPFAYGPKYNLLREYVLEISIYGTTSALALLNRIISRGMKLFKLNLYYNLFSLLCVVVVIKASISSENLIQMILLSNSIINVSSFLFNRQLFKKVI